MRTKFLSIALLITGAFLGTPALSQAELAVGETAPDFSLTDTSGTSRSLADYSGKYRVLEWTNYDCPFVKKHYGSGNMQQLQKTYGDKGVVWLSINSSAPGKQGHYAPEEWQVMQKASGVNAAAVLLDADGKVGRLYGAQTTPHMYIIDPQGILIYQGAIDSVASMDPADIAGSENYVAATLDEVMAGKPVTTSSTKSYGCSVKY